MHEVNWKWQKEVGKMFMSVQIRHLQGGHLSTVSPGWWPQETHLETDRAAAGLLRHSVLSVTQGLTDAFGLWLHALEYTAYSSFYI